MKIAWLLFAAVLPCLAQSTDWKQIVNERLPLYGHRNWIVIADSAYPAQSRDGIETVVTNASQSEVLAYVLHAVESSRHVRSQVLLDRELDFVPESEAPGVEAYRNQIKSTLEGAKTQSLPHEQIIAKLDEAGKTFRVLILKTTLTIPYTTVFLQLDCAYWTPEQEQRLRKQMSSAKH